MMFLVRLLAGGLRNDVFQVVNFGSDPTGAFETL